MDKNESKRLRKRIKTLSNAELRRMVEEEYEDYRPEAIKWAIAEMDSRGLKYTPPPPPRQDKGSVKAEKGKKRFELPNPLTCVSCGANMRFGYLFSKRETTILFVKKCERRFLEVHVCPVCGDVKLVADMETEVARDDRVIWPLGP